MHPEDETCKRLGCSQSGKSGVRKDRIAEVLVQFFAVFGIRSWLHGATVDKSDASRSSLSVLCTPYTLSLQSLKKEIDLAISKTQLSQYYLHILGRKFSLTHNHWSSVHILIFFSFKYRMAGTFLPDKYGTTMSKKPGKLLARHWWDSFRQRLQPQRLCFQNKPSRMKVAHTPHPL